MPHILNIFLIGAIIMFRSIKFAQHIIVYYSLRKHYYLMKFLISNLEVYPKQLKILVQEQSANFTNKSAKIIMKQWIKLFWTFLS